MKAVGLTDHGTFAGAIDFLKTCRKENVRPILGMEAYLSCDHLVRDKNKGRKGNRHLNLIAKNYTGFQNICALSQEASLNGYYYDPRIDLELLDKHSEGLIVTSACLSSIVNANLASDRYEVAKKAVARFKDICGEDFYLEIMYHGLEDEGKILPDIQKLAKEMDVKVIATNDCLVKGTMVLTDRGSVPIQEVCVSDKVFTHKRRWKKVYAVNRRKLQSNEKVYKVITRLGSFAYKATGNHKVLSCTTKREGNKKKPQKPIWKRTDELSSEDYLLIPKINSSDIFRNSLDAHEYIDVLDYYDGNRYLKNKSVVDPDSKIEYLVTPRSGDRNIRIPRYIKIDDDFLRMVGLFIAEGHSSVEDRQLGFSFHKNEVHLHQMVRDYFSQFGLQITERVEGNGLSLRVSSGPFHKLFGDLCGYISTDKRMPSLKNSRSFIGQWTVEQVSKILSLYFEGDGHEKKHYYLIASVSNNLISEISVCLNAMGIVSVPQVRKNTELPSFLKKYGHLPEGDRPDWNDTHVLQISGKQKEHILRFFDTGTKDADYYYTRFNFLHDASFFYISLKSVKEIEYDDEVYNFSVEEDHSYTANLFCIRNCHYIKKSDAEFQQIVMCMSSGRCLKDPNRIKFPYDEFYFKSAKEMYKIFGHVPSVMSNTLEIAEKCDYSDLIFVEDGGEMRLPKFEIPDGFSNSYDFLKKLAYEGLKNKKMHQSKEHVDRLELELNDIKLIYDTKKYDFATYFLIVNDIIQYAKEKDIMCGIRGSGYASVLLKCLGITEGVDPISAGLLWERFLGFDSKLFLCEDDFGIKP